MKRIFITGASSGIGAVFCRAGRSPWISGQAVVGADNGAKAAVISYCTSLRVALRGRSYQVIPW